MDMNYSEGAAALQRLGQTFRSILELADGLTAIGSLQQAYDEKNAAHAAKIVELDAAKDALKEVLEQRAQVHAEIVTTREDAAVAAKLAREEAEQGIADAKSQADAIVAVARETANSEAQAIVAQATAARAEEESKLASIAATVKDTQDQLDVRTAELTLVQGRLDAAREALRSFVEGK